MKTYRPNVHFLFVILIFCIFCSCKERGTFNVRKDAKVGDQMIKDRMVESIRDAGGGDIQLKDIIVESSPDIEVCVPICDQKECGPDGCGKSCGECKPPMKCQKGKCVLNWEMQWKPLGPWGTSVNDFARYNEGIYLISESGVYRRNQQRWQRIAKGFRGDFIVTSSDGSKIYVGEKIHFIGGGGAKVPHYGARIYGSTDSGKSWEEKFHMGRLVNLSKEPNLELRGMAISPSGEKLYIIVNDFTNTTLKVSNNDGNDWQVIRQNEEESINHVMVDKQGRVWITVTYHGSAESWHEIFMTSDDLNWVAYDQGAEKKGITHLSAAQDRVYGAYASGRHYEIFGFSFDTNKWKFMLSTTMGKEMDISIAFMDTSIEGDLMIGFNSDIGLSFVRGAPGLWQDTVLPDAWKKVNAGVFETNEKVFFGIGDGCFTYETSPPPKAGAPRIHWIKCNKNILPVQIFDYDIQKNTILCNTERGWYRSENRGNTWSRPEPLYWRVTPNLRKQIKHIRIDPFDFSKMYAIDKFSEYFLLSEDNGKNWQKIHFQGINFIEVNPYVKDTVFVVTDTGIFKSVNNGKEWENMDPLNQIKSKIYSLLVSKTGNHWVGAKDGIYRLSYGGGWVKIKGFNESQVSSIKMAQAEVDQDTLILYVVISKSSVIFEYPRKTEVRGKFKVLKIELSKKDPRFDSFEEILKGTCKEISFNYESIYHCLHSIVASGEKVFISGSKIEIDSIKGSKCSVLGSLNRGKNWQRMDNGFQTAKKLVIDEQGNTLYTYFLGETLFSANIGE